MAFFHAADEGELYELAVFDHSFESVEHTVLDRQDIANNWSILGVEPHGERKRVVLIERSSLAIAYVVGDGEHFGKAASPDPEEVGEIVRRFGLHWESSE